MEVGVVIRRIPEKGQLKVHQTLIESSGLYKRSTQFAVHELIGGV